MRQFQIIQYWGYNYFYLCHEGGVTKVNLGNHEYQDATHSLIEYFDWASSESIENFIDKGKELWICRPSYVDLKPKDVVLNRVLMDEQICSHTFSRAHDRFIGVDACIGYFNSLCNAKAY